MKARPIRTIGPLHFEDLDPHRFEDLIRQLAYDFRRWSSIEGVGRSGADDGADSRAYEEQMDSYDAADEDQPDDQQFQLGVRQVRLWVIQCKRYQSFTPQMARNLVDNVSLSDGEIPFGLIVAVPANISLATRRALTLAARGRGFSDIYLWGKAELEDQLLRPKNDHLLFAYFGISLQIRRRSARTEQRSLLTIKRQLVKALGPVDGNAHTHALIRCPDDEGYPFIGDRKAYLEARKWWYHQFCEHWPPSSVLFAMRRLPAYINWNTGEWDIIEDFDLDEDGYPKVWGMESDQWEGKDRQAALRETERYLRFYHEVPEGNKAELIILGEIPYARILAVDEIGDRYNKGPHLVVERSSEGYLFDLPGLVPQIVQGYGYDRRVANADPKKQIQFFPSDFPKLTPIEYEKILEERRDRAQKELGKIDYNE